MRLFTADELSRMQSTQAASLQDTCKVLSYSAVKDSYGATSGSYASGSAIACGVDMTGGGESNRTDMTVERIAATVRLPISTAVKATDRIQVTHRYGVSLSPTMTMEVVGEVKRGPSGLVVDLQEVQP